MDPAKKLAEFQQNGFCILEEHWKSSLIQKCKEAFWPVLLDYLEANRDQPNRGPHRHFLPVPLEPPCFSPAFFFDPDVLKIVHSLMGERVVIDQWGCDTPVKGSEYQGLHVDYSKPLFPEMPDFVFPPYMLVVSFGLVEIASEHGPIEIAPGTHRMQRDDAMRAVEAGKIKMLPIPLRIGDVLIRHPWALHRGTPNTTDTPRALLSLRYVRRWYADDSRDVAAMPQTLLSSLTQQQQKMMRFPSKP